jgi:hypothetical protein
MSKVLDWVGFFAYFGHIRRSWPFIPGDGIHGIDGYALPFVL